MPSQPHIVLNPGIDDLERGEWIYNHPHPFEGPLAIQIDLFQLKKEFEKQQSKMKALNDDIERMFVFAFSSGYQTGSTNAIKANFRKFS